ncbi:polyphosphate polymerase domain-containing protein [Mahella australiensis]|uniref:VTC domain protein n=1 Tax=Mahella australiensis (strain DSM 15567 / CIP 107919 / 50-1 BON) TaxID=697281 RepID=F3ZVW3_MAHA5|nr:polyphosphate polymerase domain-containing protein [Mahella australiensis]AEE95337.1 VTC domain protein [Mahella australiensis 50-1 BON]
MNQHYRHELKHEIDVFDRIEIIRRLSLALEHDPFADESGSYIVHSLYFDTPDDTALQEKLDGVTPRTKFRLRYYNDNTDFIRLEKKCKSSDLSYKESAPITFEQCRKILNGKWDWLKTTDHPLMRELYAHIATNILRPKSVVIYRREAFAHPAGNIRITVDSDIKRGILIRQFLEPYAPTVHIDGRAVLEIKYDAFLPQFICDITRLRHRHRTSFSKYAASRILNWE